MQQANYSFSLGSFVVRTKKQCLIKKYLWSFAVLPMLKLGQTWLLWKCQPFCAYSKFQNEPCKLPNFGFFFHLLTLHSYKMTGSMNMLLPSLYLNLLKLSWMKRISWILLIFRGISPDAAKLNSSIQAPHVVRSIT